MKQLFAILLFSQLLIVLLSTEAAAQSDHNSTPVIAAATTREALLLFWDEKDLQVVSATRTVKPLSEVPENVTIITSQDIENMNAHTVAEVLNRVTGLIVIFSDGGNVGSPSELHIQGSDATQVRVLLDGVTWNFIGGGQAETNSIPVGIIDHIEIIKGPASSAWGSSLGGVINIITKAAGSTPTPSGSFLASYGERNTQQYNGQVAGKAGPVGYYLYAGGSQSDGLRDNRWFNSRDLYGKFKTDLSDNTSLQLTTGYSRPRNNFGDFPDYDLTSQGRTHTFFVTASLNTTLSREISFEASVRHFKQKFAQLNDSLSSGDIFQHITYDETTNEASAKLTLKHAPHTLVVGGDFSHGRLLQTSEGDENFSTNPSTDKWAVYANDTFTVGDFTITPGVRFDRDSVAGSIVSPSIGATYKIAKRTTLRASVAKGFNSVPLSLLSGGGLYLDPNPDMKMEKVNSYQIGVESNITDYVWLKGTFFHHVTKDETVITYLPSGNRFPVNAENIERNGVEIEVETAPVYNTSVKAGFSYVNNDVKYDSPSYTFYVYNLAIKYDNPSLLMAQLFGHYVWLDEPAEVEAKYSAFVWDLNVQKNVYQSDHIKADLFLTAHNMFNGSQYTSSLNKNPRRWIEGGLRVTF